MAGSMKSFEIDDTQDNAGRAAARCSQRPPLAVVASALGVCAVIGLLAASTTGSSADARLASALRGKADPSPGGFAVVGVPSLANLTHNCTASPAYDWCPSRSTCVHSWVDSCPNGTEFCQSYCKNTTQASRSYTCSCDKDGQALDVAVRVGGSKDAHGCLNSAGYTWCPHHGVCVRGWIDSCPNGTEHCQEYCAMNTTGQSHACMCGRNGTTLDYAPPADGGNQDKHGCMTAAGYSWCPFHGRCLRGWVDSCPDGTEYCQDHCKAPNRTHSDHEVSCRCSADGRALDFAPPLRSSSDEHGCQHSEGYAWCPSLGACIRVWRETCPQGEQFCLEYCSHHTNLTVWTITGVEEACNCTSDAMAANLTTEIETIVPPVPGTVISGPKISDTRRRTGLVISAPPLIFLKTNDTNAPAQPETTTTVHDAPPPPIVVARKKRTLFTPQLPPLVLLAGEERNNTWGPMFL